MLTSCDHCNCKDACQSRHVVQKRCPARASAATATSTRGSTSGPRRPSSTRSSRPRRRPPPPCLYSITAAARPTTPATTLATTISSSRRATARARAATTGATRGSATSPTRRGRCARRTVDSLGQRGGYRRSAAADRPRRHDDGTRCALARARVRIRPTRTTTALDRTRCRPASRRQHRRQYISAWRTPKVQLSRHGVFVGPLRPRRCGERVGRDRRVARERERLGVGAFVRRGRRRARDMAVGYSSL